MLSRPAVSLIGESSASAERQLKSAAPGARLSQRRRTFLPVKSSADPVRPVASRVKKAWSRKVITRSSQSDLRLPILYLEAASILVKLLKSAARPGGTLPIGKCQNRYGGGSQDTDYFVLGSRRCSNESPGIYCPRDMPLNIAFLPAGTAISSSASATVNNISPTGLQQQTELAYQWAAPADPIRSAVNRRAAE